MDDCIGQDTSENTRKRMADVTHGYLAAVDGAHVDGCEQARGQLLRRAQLLLVSILPHPQRVSLHLLIPILSAHDANHSSLTTNAMM